MIMCEADLDWKVFALFAICLNCSAWPLIEIKSLSELNKQHVPWKIHVIVIWYCFEALKRIHSEQKVDCGEQSEVFLGEGGFAGNVTWGLGFLG